MDNKRVKPGTSLFYTGVGLIIAAGGCFVGEHFAHQEYELYKSKGVDGTAVVLDKRTEDHQNSNGDRDTNYIVTVDFSCPTIQHLKDFRYVSETDYNDCAVGKTVAVRYLPDKPQAFKWKSDAEDNGSLLLWAGGILGAIGAFLLGYGRHLNAKQPSVQDSISDATRSGSLVR